MKRNKLTSFTESLRSSQDALQFFLSWQNGFVSSTETRFSNTNWHWFLIDRSLRGGFLICLGTTDSALQSTKNKQVVWPPTIYTNKYLNAKEELWKFKYFTIQKYNLQKNPPKETKILQDIRTLYNSSQVSIQGKISSFKNPHIKIDLLFMT